MEEDQESLSAVTPTYKFEVGDILWIVGDDVDIRRLAEII